MAIITLLTLQGCAELPSLDHRHAPATLQDAAATSRGRTRAPMQEAHAGNSWDSVNQDGRPPAMAQTAPRLFDHAASDSARGCDVVIGFMPAPEFPFEAFLISTGVVALAG